MSRWKIVQTSSDRSPVSCGRIGRLEAAGLLGSYPVPEAVWAFHALCEGLAAMELRSLLPAGEEARFWRDALTALVRGFAAG
jgi:hypothetical protein